MSIEELMDVTVTLASRKRERLAETAAASYVLTGRELERLGVRSLPDALRLVPGMQVGRVDANKWVVNARSFPGLFANKLLVLIDGRSIFTPLFSGVFWESQDVVFNDIEHIEIIRGPGSSLWGANAVNGIINIVTKSANETKESFVEGGGGVGERGFLTARIGGRMAGGTSYRVFAKGFRRGTSENMLGIDPADDWSVNRVGGRVDWSAGGDAIMLTADSYHGRVGQTVRVATSVTPPYRELLHSDASIHGGHILGRWSRQFDDGSDLALQAYVDRFARDEAILAGVIHNIDVDFQHRPAWHHRHDLVWGWGYRNTFDDFDNTFTMSLQPDSRRVDQFSSFLHDRIELDPGRLRLIVGSKFEHNDYTGIEVQPNLRLWWSPRPRRILWVALSRAVRTPSRADNDVRAIAEVIPADTTVALLALLGSTEFQSENLLAVDLGFRTSLTDNLTIDVAGYEYWYDDVRTNETGTPYLEVDPAPAHTVIPWVAENRASAKARGIEIVADFLARPSWQLRLLYSHARMDIDLSRGSVDAQAREFEKDMPPHQWSLISFMNLPADFSLVSVARYVDRIEGQGIESFLTFDGRLQWRPSERLDVALVGRNLTNSPHTEFVSVASRTLPTQIATSGHLAFRWRL